MKLFISLLALGLVKQVCDFDCICYLCFFLLSQIDTVLSSASDRRLPMMPSPIFFEEFTAKVTAVSANYLLSSRRLLSIHPRASPTQELMLPTEH
jgi:hypothetical protein